MTDIDLFMYLTGKKLGNYVLHIKNTYQGRFAEETNFEIYVKDLDGTLSESYVMQGKYFSGRGKYYRPWIEVFYNHLSQISSQQPFDQEKEFQEQLFNYLIDFLPPGSHIMVVYSNHEETRVGLDRGVPAPATVLGYLLWKSGCTWFKNWYFAEGFWEGDIKLQGNKPLSTAHKKRNYLEIQKELILFLKNETRYEKIFVDAIKRAEELLKLINMEISDVHSIEL